MCKPMLDREDPVHGAVNEIISAISALNMEPAPVENPEGTYLSQVDRWAAHSMEHLDAAIALLQRAAGVHEALRNFFAYRDAGLPLDGPQLEALRVAFGRLEDRSLPAKWLAGEVR